MPAKVKNKTMADEGALMKTIIRFLIFTFLLTYLAHGFLAFLTMSGRIEFGSLAGQTLFILGGSSPAIVALAIGQSKKRFTVMHFKKHMMLARQRFGIWIFAIGVPLMLGGVFQGVSWVIGFDGFSPGVPYYLFGVLLFSSVIFGGIEELGWRGILQKNLSKSNVRLSVIAILTGIVWGVWHLPLFFIEDVSHATYAFIPFMFGAVMFSTYLTWLYAKTKSLVMVVLFHASINAAATIGLQLEFNHSFFIYAMLSVFLTIGILLLRIHEERRHIVDYQDPRT
jgi:membrane protease YdiL (CAAX protease family)